MLANFGSSAAHLVGSIDQMRALATAILASTGGCGRIAPIDLPKKIVGKRGGGA